MACPDEVNVRLPPNGKQFINGLSSSYACEYDDRLHGIIDEEELRGVVTKINSAIQEFWPCDMCLYFGMCCAPFTVIPWFPTNICMNEVERHVLNTLEQVSLRSKYYDRRIVFSLERRCCASNILITFPITLLTNNSGSNSTIGVYGSGDSPYTPLMTKNALGGDVESNDGVITSMSLQSHRKYM
jgi:hypothetical protein